MKPQDSFNLFIASPSDVKNERKIIQEVVQEWNDTHSSSFKIYDGSHAAPTSTRPQAAINRDLRKCDFTVVLFKEKWGTPPSKKEIYSSGTEEEFFTGLLCTISDDYPMKDVSVFFVDSQSQEPELEEFKSRLQESYAALYKSSSKNSLRKDFRDLLKSFVEGPHGEISNDTSLLTSRDKDLLTAELALKTANDAYGMHQVDKAREFYKRAAESGTILHKAELARFLRRTGKTADAQKVLTDECQPEIPQTYPYTSLEALTVHLELAKCELEDGRSTTARSKVSKMLESVKGKETESPEIVAHIHDCIAKAHHHQGNKDEQLKHLKEALSIRKNSIHVSPKHRIQSHLDLGRYYLTNNKLDFAKEHIDEAENLVDQANTSKQASFFTLKGQYALKIGEYDDAIRFVKEAYALNTDIEHKKGEAICLNLLGQAYQRIGDLKSARAKFEGSRDLNRKLGNNYGVRLCTEALKQLSEKIPN